MFCANTSPVPVASTDFGEIAPVMRSTSRNGRSTAGGGATVVVVDAAGSATVGGGRRAGPGVSPGAARDRSAPRGRREPVASSFEPWSCARRTTRDHERHRKGDGAHPSLLCVFTQRDCRGRGRLGQGFNGAGTSARSPLPAQEPLLHHEPREERRGVVIPDAVAMRAAGEYAPIFCATIVNTKKCHRYTPYETRPTRAQPFVRQQPLRRASRPRRSPAA